MNKRVISLLLIIIFTLSFFPSGAYGASNTKVKVTLQSVVCVENNHVGNEWGYGATVNKKAIYEGQTLEISTTPNGKITIVSSAEEDDTYPDYGSKTLTVSVSKLKANTSAKYTSNVTVIENRGRYSGNSAVWKFTYVIKKK